jgi:uncharacterized membrane protein
MSRKRGGLIVLIVIAVLIIGAFAFVALRTPRTVEDATEVSELDELLNKDVSANYPATPREVLKLYNRYLLCLYGVDGEELTDTQVQELGKKMRELYDEELLESNTEEINLSNLEQELASFQKADKVMIQTNVGDSNDVDYIDVDGADGALLQASYFIREGSKEFSRTYQQYLLRKDDEGDWKILSFVKVNGGDD